MPELSIAGPPAPGELIEISEGILWGRMPLPFRLDHVNIYFIRDGDGWVAVDTGLCDPETKGLWEVLLNGPLKGGRIVAVLATHHHPDHIGLAGWLHETQGAVLLTSATSFLCCQNLYNKPKFMAAAEYRRFYESHGVEGDVLDMFEQLGQIYADLISRPAPIYRRLLDGMAVTFGGDLYQVFSGDGHSPEQLMLFQPERKLFFAADQVLQKISPHIAVQVYEPHGDPLGSFLASLQRITRLVAADALVLPGHHQPFYGLHDRIAELEAHHAERFEAIRGACRVAPQSVMDILPVLFRRPLSPRDTTSAFTEALAHVNCLVDRGELCWHTDADGRRRAVAAS